MWETCVADDQTLVQYNHTLYCLTKIITLPNKYQCLA
jgi:hypothetical protein